MKLNAVLLYVSDLAKTRAFYTTLGGTVTVINSMMYTIDLGGFVLQCVDQAQAKFPIDFGVQSRGAGVFFYIELEDVDAAYAAFVEKGIQPSTEPKDWEWGNREFVVKDPDGYKLVFYKKLAKV